MGIPDRQLLIMTVLVTSVASIVFLVGERDWVAMLVALPLFATFSFWSIKISRWVAHRFVPQARPPELSDSPEEVLPTSRRPEHARRRRQRRRQRRP
jgi:hypothetical protein